MSELDLEKVRNAIYPIDTVWQGCLARNQHARCHLGRAGTLVTRRKIQLATRTVAKFGSEAGLGMAAV